MENFPNQGYTPIRLATKPALALALLVLHVLPVRADDATIFAEQSNPTQADMPAPLLVQLDRALTQKQEAMANGLLTPDQYQEFIVEFRAELAATMTRVPPDSINKGLHAQILARLSGAESNQAANALRAGLNSDPADHTLRAALGVVEYERKNYREAAAEAKALLDPALNPPPSKEIIEKARALWFMAKDRGVGREAGGPALEANSPPSAAKETKFNFSSPARRKSPVEPPSLSGRTDPAWEATRAGRETLEKSALGRDLLAYSRDQGVRYELTDLPLNVGAQYDPVRNMIMVPRDVAKLDPVESAVHIGHEAFHARQVLRDGMIASVEVEQDAKFAGHVIYHELLKAGEQPLPADNSIQWNYGRFSRQVGHQNFSAFNEDIRKMYEGEREAVLNRAVEKAPAATRGFLRRAYTAIDADFLRSYETLEYQENKWWNLPERRSITNTRKEHRIEQAWQLKWMKEHQKEFPPPAWPR